MDMRRLNLTLVRDKDRKQPELPGDLYSLYKEQDYCVFATIGCR
jgi:hypothetical protein